MTGIFRFADFDNRADDGTGNCTPAYRVEETGSRSYTVEMLDGNGHVVTRGTVNLSEASKLLLGMALFFPKSADVLAKQSKLRILHWTSSISAHGFLLHGL